MSQSCGSSSADLASRPLAIALWGVPAAAIAAGWVLGGVMQPVLWVPAFAVMGAACLANARRCNRTHCLITGPLFIGASIASLLRGTGILPLPWEWIALAAGAGTAAAFGWECLRGRYREPACGAAPKAES